MHRQKTLKGSHQQTHAYLQIHLHSSGRLKSWVFYCFHKTKHPLPRDTSFTCQNVSVLFVSFQTCQVILMGSERASKNRDYTDLLPSSVGPSVKVILHQQKYLADFTDVHQKGHVALEWPSGSFPGYLTPFILLSAGTRQKTLVRLCQERQ